MNNQSSILRLRAAHGVSAVEAAVTGSVADGDASADIAGGGIVLEMLELGVEQLHGTCFRLAAVGVGDQGGYDLHGSVRYGVR